MDRGRTRVAILVTMAGFLVAGQTLAGRPGDRSRKTAALPTQIKESAERRVQNAVGFAATGSHAPIQQVVGKQPGPRTVDPDRTLSLMPALLGASRAQPLNVQRTTTTQSRRQNDSRPSGGLLGELFGNPSPPSRTAAASTNADSQPVDWNGIPYHQARSSSTPTNRTPIRDPRPGETRISGNRAVPRLADLSPAPSVITPADLPKPPALAPAPSARRVAPSRVASSRLNRADSPELSPSASSRRSGRRDVPSLDASEIAAAKADDISEEDLIPKVSRRRIQVEVAANDKSKADKPATTPAVDVPPTKKPAAESVAASITDLDRDGEAETTTATESIASRPNRLTPPEVAPAAPREPSETHGDDFGPSHEAPSARVADSTAPQFVAPTIPPAGTRNRLPQPSAPSFGPPGSVAGYRSGPSANAFSSTFQARSNPTVGLPAAPKSPSSPAVGSGLQPPRVTTAPSARGSYPTDPYAAQPPMQPQAGPPAFPTMRTTPPPAATRPLPLPNPTIVAMPATAAPTEPAPASTFAESVPPTLSMSAERPKPTAATPSPVPPAKAFDAKPFASTASAPHRSNNTLEPGNTAVASELPGIRIVTHGPASIVIRETHSFEIRAENRGSIDASGLLVRAIVPNWAEIKGHNATRGDIESETLQESDRLVWKIESLPAGTVETLFVRLQAQQSGKHGLDVEWTLLPQKSVANIEVHEPKLDLLIEGPEEVVYGESQTYKVRVLNPGDGTAPNVVFTLSPNSSTPQTQRIGDIPSGKEAQFEVELTAQDLGDLKIHGLASGDLSLKAEADKTIRVSAAELEAVLTGPEIKYQNTDAVYALEVTNNGTATTKNVVATMTLPAGVRYLGGIDSAKQRGPKLSWEIDSLAPGASTEYEFKCSMTSPGEQVFQFDAAGTAAGKTSVSLGTQVESIADLVMTIQDPAAPAPVGSEVTYEILIKNRGSRAAEGVRAIAQFSHGIEPRSVDGHPGQVLTGQVLFDPIDSIGAGEEIRIKVIAEAETAGHHRFRTEIRSGETVLVAEEATHYMSKRTDRVSRRSESSSLR